CDMTDEIAEGLLRCMIKNGPIAYKNPSDYDAMCEVFWASSLSHNNLTECGRGKDFSVHKFGHALSAKYDVTHGDSLSAVWGAWAKELFREALPRFVRFARKVWEITETDDEKAALLGIEKTVDFFRSIGMPVSLKDLGINPSDEDLRSLSLDATMQDTVKLSRIRPLDAAGAYKIYRAALH
ncbi:MAG: iron-containing alcohol dehydrogenase, partial [Lachnospiraceae bacterium]|nr:iron-containing alcohol dehydrogenase [Lachnospiraceae bacterium]